MYIVYFNLFFICIYGDIIITPPSAPYKCGNYYCSKPYIQYNKLDGVYVVSDEVDYIMDYDLCSPHYDIDSIYCGLNSLNSTPISLPFAFLTKPMPIVNNFGNLTKVYKLSNYGYMLTKYGIKFNLRQFMLSYYYNMFKLLTSYKNFYINISYPIEHKYTHFSGTFNVVLPPNVTSLETFCFTQPYFNGTDLKQSVVKINGVEVDNFYAGRSTNGVCKSYIVNGNFSVIVNDATFLYSNIKLYFDVLSSVNLLVVLPQYVEDDFVVDIIKSMCIRFDNCILVGGSQYQHLDDKFYYTKMFSVDRHIDYFYYNHSIYSGDLLYDFEFDGYISPLQYIGGYDYWQCVDDNVTCDVSVLNKLHYYNRAKFNYDSLLMYYIKVYDYFNSGFRLENGLLVKRSNVSFKVVKHLLNDNYDLWLWVLLIVVIFFIVIMIFSYFCNKSLNVYKSNKGYI